jgi:hypothetical protein
MTNRMGAVKLQAIDEGEMAPSFTTTDLYGNVLKGPHCKWPRQRVVWSSSECEDFSITGFGLARPGGVGKCRGCGQCGDDTGQCNCYLEDM